MITIEATQEEKEKKKSAHEQGTPTRGYATVPSRELGVKGGDLPARNVFSDLQPAARYPDCFKP